MFAFHFLRWKMVMLRNLVAERREYVVLAAAGVGLGGSGLLTLSWKLGQWLVEPWQAGDMLQLNRSLQVFCFALWLGIFLMGLANVITRFFGAGRLEERERLMGPLHPLSLMWAEVLDAWRLPLFVASFLLILPFTVAVVALSLPLWLWVVVVLYTVTLFLQPVLGVMALTITAVWLIPSGWLGRQGLMFFAFFGVCLGVLLGLDTLRGILEGRFDLLTLLPTYGLASVPALFFRGEYTSILGGLALAGGVCAGLALWTYKVYRDNFLKDLNHFHLDVAAVRGDGRPGVWRGWLGRWLSAPVLAVVMKDLRSARRDTAQRVAFTLIGALVSAMVLGDLLRDTAFSPMFLPIFLVYALFLVACQGLSSFSAEGNLADNLARLPLSARDLLLGKVLAQAVVFFWVFAGAALLLGLSPMPVPWLFRPVIVLLGVGCGLPVAVVLAWFTVTLGAIFPRQGEGGAQKEISIFAMGLFLQLLGLLGVSGAGAILTTFLGGWFWLAPVGDGLVWIGVGITLWRLALQRVEGGLRNGAGFG